MFYQKRKMDKKVPQKLIYSNMNKKAQGLSINAIILIILAVAVLVILVLGFVMGWEKIFPWLGGKNNVDTVRLACELACSQQSLYDYCSFKRELNNGTSKFKDISCYTLSSFTDVFDIYGVSPCYNLNCKSAVKCDDWKYIGPDGKTEVKVADELVKKEIPITNLCTETSE